MTEQERTNQLAKALVLADCAEWDGNDADVKARRILRELESRGITMEDVGFLLPPKPSEPKPRTALSVVDLEEVPSPS